MSVFIADTTKAPEMADIAKNAVKRFKTIRHPNILSVVTTHEVNGVYYIATERVTPLQHVLGEQVKEPDEMLYGIKQVGVCFIYLFIFVVVFVVILFLSFI